MSGAGFELDPDLLKRTAVEVDGVRARLVQATSALRAGVDGTGNPWGADAQGSAFAQVYSDVLTHAFDVMATHADQLDYASRSLTLSAEDHEQNDDNVRALFESMGEGL